MHYQMKIAIASDHAGFELKEHLKTYLKKKYGEKIRVVDFGPKAYVEGDDYPDYISLAALEVSKDPAHVRGIVIGGSGQGEAMVANRYRNVRALVYYGNDLKIIRVAREHNDANVISLGARYMTLKEAEKAVDACLNEPFSGEERHVRRIKKIECLPFTQIHQTSISVDHTHKEPKKLRAEFHYHKSAK
ncbi:MAG: RpiB/LacA/LacB family sugar-phosphate isomerase [bacterium]